MSVEAPTYCIIDFDKNGAAAGPEIKSVTVDFGEGVSLPGALNWEYFGYAFAGWNTEPDGSGESFGVGMEFSPGDRQYRVRLYAQWDYVLEGVGSGGSEANFIYVIANIPRLPLDYRAHSWSGPETYYPTRSGDHFVYSTSWIFSSKGVFTVPRFFGDYELDGWYAARFWDISNDQPVANYDRCISQAAEIDGSTIVNNTPYQNSDGGGNGTVARDVCIKYRPKRVSILLDATGGDVSQFLVQARFSEAYGELPTPIRRGWSFVGWFTSENGGEQVTADTIVTNSSDHTLFAHWEHLPVTVDVYFNACGGTCEAEKISVTSGAAYGALPTPVRDGCEFAGWYTASLGGSRVSAETIVGQTYTHWLYAQWKQIKKPSGGGSAGMFKVS